MLRLAGIVAVVSALVAAGCVQAPPGDRLCKDVPQCECNKAQDHGAVVVRWRISDGQAGQLFGRGECCCSPCPAPPSTLAGQQCGRFGSDCPTSPAWLIRQVHLLVTSVATGSTCIISRPCTDAELQTEYCLPEGTYDLQLTADVDVYDPSYREFVCANRQAISPPAVRRRILAGRAVNLDGIVLGVNAPPTGPPPDGGLPSIAEMCSAATDGGAHE
jgi:hypothetical protein